MRKTMITAIILTTLLVCVPLTSHADGLTDGQARDTASRFVPSGSVFLSAEADGDEFSVKFYHEDRREQYEIDIDMATGKPSSFESWRYPHHGSGRLVLTKDQAGKAVTGEIESAEILSVELENSGKEYEVRFKTDTFYGKYSIHGENGSILERDIRFRQAPPTAAPDTGIISAEQALKLAEDHIPGCTVTDVDLEWEEGVYLYEVEAYRDGVEYKMGFDAVGGRLIWEDTRQEDWSFSEHKQHSARETAPGGQAYIGEEKAKSIALEKVPGAEVKRCRLDYEDGRPVYEGELIKDGWEYEFEIDAVTGQILDWDQEYDD